MLRDYLPTREDFKSPGKLRDFLGLPGAHPTFREILFGDDQRRKSNERPGGVQGHDRYLANPPTPRRSTLVAMQYEAGYESHQWANYDDGSGTRKHGLDDHADPYRSRGYYQSQDSRNTHPSHIRGYSSKEGHRPSGRFDEHQQHASHRRKSRDYQPSHSRHEAYILDESDSDDYRSSYPRQSRRRHEGNDAYSGSYRRHHRNEDYHSHSRQQARRGEETYTVEEPDSLYQNPPRQQRLLGWR